MNQTYDGTECGRLARLTTALLVVATFILITTGGLVTSLNAGLAVPDWPTSFGKWLVIPFQLWADLGVFLEHNHRLTGAVAGLIAIGAFSTILQRQGKSKLSFLAGLILVLYIVQGVLGGYRVTEQSIELAILHGVHGQIVLALTVILATLVRRPARSATHMGRRPWIAIHGLPAGLVVIILIQLTLGAVVRHTSTASSIPDAPLVFGKLIPPSAQAASDAGFYEFGGDEFRVYVEEPALPMEAVEADQTPGSLEKTKTRPATPARLVMVWQQYIHRVFGMLLIPAVIVAMGYRLSRSESAMAAGRGPMLALLGLWIVQIVLGLSVIWSRERWEITAGHQAVGAAILAVATWLAIRLHCPPRKLGSQQPR